MVFGKQLCNTSNAKAVQHMKGSEKGRFAKPVVRIQTVVTHVY